MLAEELAHEGRARAHEDSTSTCTRSSLLAGALASAGRPGRAGDGLRQQSAVTAVLETRRSHMPPARDLQREQAVAVEDQGPLAHPTSTSCLGLPGAALELAHRPRETTPLRTSQVRSVT